MGCVHPEQSLESSAGEGVRVAAPVEREDRTEDRRPGVSVLKAEANLLRFPLFAISTKGLKALDGIERRGPTRRGPETRPSPLRVPRNTGSLFPGPLARRIHFALLGLAAERGVPLRNPVTWSWRELCGR